MNNTIKRRYEVNYNEGSDWVPVDESTVRYIFSVGNKNADDVIRAMRMGETVSSFNGVRYREAGHVTVEEPLDLDALGAEADVSHALAGVML